MIRGIHKGELVFAWSVMMNIDARMLTARAVWLERCNKSCAGNYVCQFQYNSWCIFKTLQRSGKGGNCCECAV